MQPSHKKHDSTMRQLRKPCAEPARLGYGPIQINSVWSDKMLRITEPSVLRSSLFVSIQEVHSDSAFDSSSIEDPRISPLERVVTLTQAGLAQHTSGCENVRQVRSASG